MRAYSLYRPVSIGTYPSDYTVKAITNYDRRMYVEAIGRNAWGHVDYADDVPVDVLERYEMVTERPADDRLLSVSRAICRALRRGDEDRAADIAEKAQERYGLRAYDIMREVGKMQGQNYK